MRFLIISGGSLERDFAFAYFNHEKWDGIIAADSGLFVCEEAGIFPDYIVGDFDSLGAGTADTDRARRAEALLQTYAKKGAVIRRFKPEKDWTDTQIAVEAALELSRAKKAGADASTQSEQADPQDQIHLLGGTGTRLDHVLGNLQVMELALRRGAHVILSDPHNRIQMYDRPVSLQRQDMWGDYISLIPWAGDVKGLSLRGFKYPLEEAVLVTGESLGISNELSEERGEISFTEGLLLVICSGDKQKRF